MYLCLLECFRLKKIPKKVINNHLDKQMYKELSKQKQNVPFGIASLTKLLPFGIVALCYFVTSFVRLCGFIFYHKVSQRVFTKYHKGCSLCNRDNQFRFSTFNFQMTVVLSLFFVFANETQATIRYVRPTPYGSADASSWQNSSDNLQLIINQSVAGDTIFVAQGTYKPIYTADGYNAATHTYPTTDGGSDNAFVLKDSIQIYGSFPNNGTATWEQRDWNAYPTILSGEINSYENCYHVILSVNVSTATVLDGFTITKGEACGNSFYPIIVNGEQIAKNAGGGMYNFRSSPTLTHVTISENMACDGGGGMYNYYSSPVLTYVSISENTSSFLGGGIFNDYYSSPILTHVSISGNTGGSVGGGICNYDYSSPVLTHVTIIGNDGGSHGGGMDNRNSSSILTNVFFSGNNAGAGGGIFTHNSTTILTNVLISGNSAFYGGGICFECYDSATLTNVTISGNSALLIGGGIFFDTSFRKDDSLSSFIIRNSIVWGNLTEFGFGFGFDNDNIANNNPYRSSYDACLVGDAPLGNGIILNSNPLFADTAKGDYRLSCLSLAIDAGNNSYYSSGQTPDLSSIKVDLDGNPRFYSMRVDLGAYEFQEPRATMERSADTTICYGDTVVISVAFAGAFSWELVYTKDDGLTFDTVQSVSNNLFEVAVSPPDTTVYRFIALRNSHYICIIEDTIQINILPKPPFFTNIFSNDTVCHGGKTQAVVFTGVDTADYDWQAIGGVLGLPTGIQKGNFDAYVVGNKEDVPVTSHVVVQTQTVADGIRCVYTDTVFSIRVFPELVLSNPLPNDTLCSGEQTNVVVFTGGANMYQWQASGDSINYIPAGRQTGDFSQYLVEIKDNKPLTTHITITPSYTENGKICAGCDTNFSITVYPVPTFTTVLENDTLCDGEITKPVFFHGDADFFEWIAIGNVSGLPQGVQSGDFGSYTLSNESSVSTKSVISVTPRYTLGRGACEKSESFEIVVHPATLIRSFFPDSKTFSVCGGEEGARMEVTATGIDISYQWYYNAAPLPDAHNNYYEFPAITSANSGTYYVEVLGYCGSAKSRSIDIELGDINILVWEWDDEIIIDNSSRQYYAFQWYRNDIPIPGATNGKYKEKGGLNGCYRVELTLSTDWQSKVRSCERCFDKTKKYIHTYPNPAQSGEVIHVQFVPHNQYINFKSAELYSITGQQLWKQEMDCDSFEIDTRYLSAGMYVLLVTTDDYWRYEEKVIIY